MSLEHRNHRFGELVDRAELRLGVIRSPVCRFRPYQDIAGAWASSPIWDVRVTNSRLGEDAEALALRLAEDLRDAGFFVDLGYSGNLARRMRRADRIGARAAVLLGEDELAKGIATVRDLDSGEQSEVSMSELPSRLTQFFS